MEANLNIKELKIMVAMVPAGNVAKLVISKYCPHRHEAQLYIHLDGSVIITIAVIFSNNPCEKLFKGKAHIPRSSKSREANKLAVYSMSMIDGKRNRIVKEDLCDHVWEFHFKMTAPEYWLNLDPSWKGTGPPMRRYFHPDGSQTADPGDLVWGGHESAFSIVTSYVGEEGRIRRHYVRINRWQEMTVSRREDWSWEMANHVYCYNSIPDADKGGTGPFYPVC